MRGTKQGFFILIVTGGFVRRMDYPIQVSGYEVPANTFVICFPGQQYTLQKDTLWDDSKEFNPRRFFSVQLSFFGWETIILQEDEFFFRSFLMF